MAYYAALTSLSQTLDQIPQPHQQQIASLREKVSRLLLILDDSPLKINLAIKDLEGRIRGASYKAEDIIQFHILGQVLSKSLSRRASSFSIRLEKCLPENLDLIFQSLERIIDEFDSILEALSNKVKDGRGEYLQPGNSLAVGSSRFAAGDKSTSVGLDEDMLQIKDRLTGSQSKLDIISIVGMGGIGKTTLARNLYGDSLIEDHFHIRAWAVASQAYDMREMLKNLLNSIIHGGRDALQHKSIGETGEILHKSLKGRRYLIVIDDIWDAKAWDDIKRFCPNDNNGSRIILTTRLSNIATYANSYSSIHQMSLLSSEASWNLLCEKVFENECCPFELEKTGKKISKNCKGLPLAIVGISGLLRKGSKTQEYWKYIAKNINSAVTGDDDQCMKVLSLSYDSLPRHLKACFLYIGVFPEDRVIVVSKLIKLWVAEGFIKPSSLKSLEDVAKDYLNDLIDRSLIVVCQRNHNGGAKTFVIHDLWRELCVKKAEDEEFFQIIDSDDCNFTQGGNNQRRVSIHKRDFRISHFQDSHVRTLLYFCRLCPTVHWELAHKLLSKGCRLLRVFDALKLRFNEFPIEIVELVHLRYLAVRFKSYYRITEPISKLVNLQTLILHEEENGDPIYLASSIWKMPQLRHLIFINSSYLPMKIKGENHVVLENLQTLSGIKNLICRKKVLEMMPNLKKLSIFYNCEGNTEWYSTYEINNLVYLRQIEKLECKFVGVKSGNPVPVNFALPANLKKLTLRGCRFPWEKMTNLGSLPNLEVLKLKYHAFKGPVWEPNEGEFSKLKFLLIDDSSLCLWRASDIHFPRLQRLSLSDCYLLKEIPCEIGEIPTLELLELCNCGPSVVASAKIIQEEQQSLENNTLRVVFHRRRDNF